MDRRDAERLGYGRYIRAHKEFSTAEEVRTRDEAWYTPSYRFLREICFSVQRIMRYTTVVDPGVEYDPRQLKEELAVYLADPGGWVSRGVTFTYVSRPSDADVVIHLTPAKRMASFGCDTALSCAEFNGRHVYLNAKRWFKGAAPSKLSLYAYRQYMVTHELGHILGYDHTRCPGRGVPAPVMIQQTMGIGPCKPNTRVTKYDVK